MRRYLKTPQEVIQALKEGKIIRDDESQWTLLEGCIVRKDNDFDVWVVNDAISSNYTGLYIDEPESLKLEVGKFYRTRRGDKVVCLCHRGDYYIHRLNSYIVGYWVDKTGRALFNGVPERTETDSDVVALWEDNNASKN